MEIIKRIIKKILPAKILNYYRGYVKGWLIKPQKSYSQKGEDLILYNYFGKGFTGGFYLDIGCFHPKQISNTYLFHKFGWYGFAVDIDHYKTDLFARFRKGRCDVLTTAVTGKKNESEIAKVYKFGDKGGWSDIDTLDFETAKYYRGDIINRGDFRIEEIATISINELLEKLPQVNFLNIDIEGLDIEILEYINLTKFSIDAILFEDNINWGGTKKIQEKMEKHGYKLLFVSGGSICYAKDKSKK